MATTDELTGFVRESISRGIPRDDIAAVLLSAGWNGEQVQAALDAFAPIAYPIAVPRPRQIVDARDAFLYLLRFGALWSVTFNVGHILFALVDLAFPDRGSTATAFGAAIRFSLASLVVSLPVYVLVARLTGRAAARDVTRRISPVRRWLTYATMLVAAAVGLGDVTALVYGLLGGTLTVPLTLKLGTVLALAGGTLGYHLNDMRIAEEDVSRGALPTGVPA